MTGTKLASKSAVREESMIRPIIHRQLTRGDLACLVDEIARMDVCEGRDADQALQAGAVATSQSQRTIARGENGMAEWWRFVAALPQGTVAQAEAAADAAAVALWWAGCFPEWVERGSAGSGMVRAYVTFAGRMLALAADLLESSAPEEASLCARAAEARTELHAALAEARVDYIGEDPHSSESRLNRFLRRLAQDN